MNRIFAALLALACFVTPTLSATLLPPGQQQFLDQNGKPLVGGTIAFYRPGTTTPKDTYKDAAQGAANLNPVVLDSSGRATIYGAGAYRMILRDQFGNVVYDTTTADTASAATSWGGSGAGTVNAQTVTAPNFSGLDGQEVVYIASATNTGALTINPNGTGPIAVLKDSATGPLPLAGGEVVAGNVVDLIYEQSRGIFHLLGALSAPGIGAEVAVTAGATTDIGSAATHFALVSGGNANIVSFGSNAVTSAPLYQVKFGNFSVLKQSAQLDLPGGADIVTSPNDTALAEYLGSNKWRVLNYSSGTGVGMPTGMIGAFAMSACPGGWGAADGSAISRVNYQRAFAFFGTTYGAGDGSSTFNLPDLRGVFLRGVDNGRGLDTGRGFGTYQADALQDHTHAYNFARPTFAGGAGGTNSIGDSGSVGTTGGVTTGSANTASETRPKNVAILYCVKL